MPKSRFNAVREKARASRHNPIKARGNQGDQGEEHEQAFSIRPRDGAAANGDRDQVLPVLKSLPLHQGETQRPAANDVLWALTSLAGFLTVKAQRTELLLPKHELVQRILLQLTPNSPIEVRDAASGCLRNLCVEAGGRARKLLEHKQCISACIAEIKKAAEDLGLLSRDRIQPTSSGTRQFSAQQDMSFLNKPKSEMNRKERRHAAKAEAAAAKKQERMNGKLNQEQEVSSMATDADEVDDTLSDEQKLICCSHLSNLVAVLWCLTEVSNAAMDVCERSAQLLCSVFARATEQGVSAMNSLQSTAIEADASKVVDIGKRDKRQLDRAFTELALTSLNALVTMSEYSAQVCAALVGISRQELNSALKGKKRSVVLSEVDELTTSADQDGRRNLQALCAAIDALQGSAKSDCATTIQKQAKMLGLLALATLHNTQAALPQPLRTKVQIAGPSSDLLNLQDFEVLVGLTCLESMLSKTAQDVLQNEVINSDISSQDDNSSALNLALEILAEYAGDKDGWGTREKRSKAEGNEIEVDRVGDDDMAESAEGSESETEMEDDVEDADADLSTDVVTGIAHGGFHSHRIARFFQPHLLEPLSILSFQLSEQTISSLQAQGTPAKSSSILRGISIRSLSVLSNTLLALASHAKPPPSQPISSAAQEERIAAFHKWFGDDRVSSRMSQLWRWCFELASRMAALPQIGQALANEENDDQNCSVECRKIMENCLGIMWSISRCYEGHQAGSDVLAINSDDFVNDAFCVSARQGAGVVQSLVAAYRGSKQSNDVAVDEAAAEGPVAVTSDPTTCPSSDGIRVHCLGVLSTLMRQPNVWQAHLASIATLLCAAVEVAPAHRQQAQQMLRLAELNVSDVTSADGMIVAINGIIDTFADEAQPWDAVYTQLKLQGKLKRVSQDVRNAARTIDKRKQATLRAAADDAWENLIGFLQYRDSLKN